MTASGLEDLPGVSVTRCPPGLHLVGAEPDALTVRVGLIAGMSGTPWCGVTWECAEVPVPLDFAHDLSWLGPAAFIWTAGLDDYGYARWHVHVYGFILAEAEDAFIEITEMLHP